MSKMIDILVVDDERINLVFMQRALKELDLNVVLASSAYEALELLEEHDFALILLDIMMPGMDGFECAERIRENPMHHDIPIIFVTAISKEQRHVFRGYELGAVDYLFKPVEPAILRSKVLVFVELFRKQLHLEDTTRQLQRVVSELTESKRALQSSEHRYRTVADYNYDWEAWIGADGEVLYMSPSSKRISGYPPEQFSEEPELLERMVHHSDLPRWKQFMESRRSDRDVDSLDYRIYNKNTRVRWVNMVRQPVMDERGEYHGMRLSIRDITDRMLLEEQISHQMLHDPLTGLGNRAMFLDQVRKAQVDYETPFAVAFLNIDRFKVVNDSLGHAGGDRLLMTTSRRLLDSLGEDEYVARIGGDEFALILTGFEDEDGALERGGIVNNVLREPIRLGKNQVRSSASVGLVIADKDTSADELLQNAQIAMYRIKDNGRDDCNLFQESMKAQVAEVLTLENAMRQALEDEEFVLDYQPIIEMDTGRIHGLEALIRWQHPEKGLLGPGQFIPVAEDTGFIVDMGKWIISHACHTLAGWEEGDGITMSVNISGRQFHEQGLVTAVREALASSGLEPSRLKLEITETVIMVDAHESVHRLKRLHDLGVTLSVDDFGTGYSSMSYLQRFALDQLKVDLSFVQRLDKEPESIEIVRAIINLAHSLSLKVVAEGIETDVQRNLLYSLQCDYGQGYLFSRPIKEDDVPAFIRENRGKK